MSAGRNKDAAKQGGAADDAAATKTPACPICGKPRDDHYRPFCSKRCADVDLGRWLHGSYAIPVTEDADEDGDAGALSAGPGEAGTNRVDDE
jgi:endogenous inhibitor of DNA gyrase (YacG/DUF329 family)